MHGVTALGMVLPAAERNAGRRTNAHRAHGWKAKQLVASGFASPFCATTSPPMWGVRCCTFVVHCEPVAGSVYLLGFQ